MRHFQSHVYINAAMKAGFTAQRREARESQKRKFLGHCSSGNGGSEEPQSLAGVSESVFAFPFTTERVYISAQCGHRC